MTNHQPDSSRCEDTEHTMERVITAIPTPRQKTLAAWVSVAFSSLVLLSARMIVSPLSPQQADVLRKCWFMLGIIAFLLLFTNVVSYALFRR